MISTKQIENAVRWFGTEVSLACTVWSGLDNSRAHNARLRSVDGELIYEAGGAVIPRWFAGAEKREVA